VDPGWEEGNCLRSHVNLAETINSLSMITKAGVSNIQLVVGVASYGRVFKMSTAGCWTEMCTYTGPDSESLAGQCTETAGYRANTEIEAVIADNPSTQVYWDSDAFSNVLVYNCLPGRIGSSGGGSSSSSDPDDDDDDDNDSSSTTTTTTTTTSFSYRAAGFHIDAGDTFPRRRKPGR
jgi:hypothetical protein